MKLKSLADLYTYELRDLYSAEVQLTKALPKLAENASSPELRRALEQHLEETRTQVQRLETIFNSLGERPGGEKCEAMEGLVSEGEELLDEEGEPEVIDAGIIVAAQKVEHYEIAGYGSMVAFARTLGRDEDAAMLQETLDEEKKADRTLTEIAERAVNKQCAP